MPKPALLAAPAKPQKSSTLPANPEELERIQTRFEVARKAKADFWDYVEKQDDKPRGVVAVRILWLL